MCFSAAGPATGSGGRVVFDREPTTEGVIMTEFRAGAGQADITPLAAGIPAQLGGYGERNGAHAHGVHDAIRAKALVFEQGERRCALASLDVCHAPRSLVEEALARADVPGLDYDNTLVTATHTHAGIEGFSMDRRNTAGNPRIGVFDERVLDFVADRLALALREAHDLLQPARAGSATLNLPGMNANRRTPGGETDDTLTVLRIDTANGTPYCVFFNYAAHGTLMTPECMLVSGGWPGVAQRTVEDYMGRGVTALFTNGAEGNQEPAGAVGASPWEQAERYGRAVGLAAGRLAESIATLPVHQFRCAQRWVDLPPFEMAPDFVEIAGAEYGVSAAELQPFMRSLLPERAPLYSLRMGAFQLLSFPGEPTCAMGRAAKAAMARSGVQHPCVLPLTNDYIGYILAGEEYRASGYEATVSFYGEGLGELLVEEAGILAQRVAAAAAHHPA
jgi:hypothetical protein